MHEKRVDLAFQLKGWAKKIYREGPHFQRISRRMLPIAYYAEAEIQHYQLTQLRKMIHYCAENVPYYTDLFRRIHLKADDIHSLSDIERIPHLDKHIVKANFDKMSTKSPRKYFSRKGITSGTTGMPGQFLRDFESINFENAAVWRYWHQAGDHGKKRITIRGERVTPVAQNHPPFWKENPANRELIMSGYHLSAETSLAYIQKILEFKPAILYAYPSTAFLLAQFFRRHEIPYYFDAVFTSSEMVESFMREYVETTFDTRIYDWYGQTERVAAIAGCSQGRYHIQEDYALTELLPTEYGHEVVGSHFHNHVMPLLRYRTGDYVQPTLEECPCGSHFRTIDTIVGRTSEVLITPEGRSVPNVASLAMREMETEHILEVQFVQESQGEVTLKVVSTGQLTDSDRDQLRYNTLRHTSPSMRINILEVPRIERGPNGKFSGVINTCKPMREVS